MSGDSVYAHVEAVTSAARRLRTTAASSAPVHRLLGHAGADAAMGLLDTLASDCESTVVAQKSRVANAVDLVAVAIAQSDHVDATVPLRDLAV